MANPEEGRVLPTTQESLSNREIVQRTTDVLTEYGEESLKVMRPLIRKGMAKEVLGFVRNRPGEQMHLIDSVGEHLLANIARAHNLPSRVIGEQNTYYTAENQEPAVDITNDSLDNTSPYIRGLDINPYTVAGAFDHKTGNPIGGVIVDIERNRIYRSSKKQNTVKDVETGEIKPLQISKRKDIGDPNITIASFISEKEYFEPFARNFGPMMEAFDRKGFLYPGGGSFIYALLASGAVDAYVMVGEPRSEIDPGLPFLLNGGGKAVSVDPETGEKSPYKFDPEQTAAGSVPLFIAYAQEEIADQIVKLYLQGKNEAEERDVALEFYRRAMEENKEYFISNGSAVAE